jgi:hypothetical protein
MKTRGAARSPSPIVVTIRGSAEWKRWHKDFAAAKRLAVASVIDHALAGSAKEADFRASSQR